MGWYHMYVNRILTTAIVGLILTSLLLIYPAESYNTPGKAPVPSGMTKDSSVKKEISSEPDDGAREGKSTNVRVYMPDSKKCPLEITKRITPKSQDDMCIVNSPFRVLVDIKCIEENIDNIQILERIDSNMDVAADVENNNLDEIFNFYIIYTLQELANFHEGYHVNNKTYLDNHLEDFEKAKVESYGNHTYFVNIDTYEIRRS